MTESPSSPSAVSPISVDSRRLLAAEDLSADDSGMQAAYFAHARPRLAELLASIGLDVVYREGRGAFLRYERNGSSVEVLDLLSGYGAALLGHHHPELVAIAEDSLQRAVPMHAQASTRGWSAVLCERLTARLRQSTGRRYLAHLLSTGSEAVEGAIRHAEIARRHRLDGELARAESEARAWEEAVATGACERTIAREALGEVWLADTDRASCTEVIAWLRERNRKAAQRPPTFLALEHAYHGCGTAAAKLSWGKRFRSGLSLTGVDARFLPIGDRDAWERIVRESTIEIWIPSRATNGAWHLERCTVPGIAGLLVECVQGEGGVRPLPAEDLLAIQALCRRTGITLIADEIQCGLGRTGRFLALEEAGLAPDVILLSKVLGGGLAKIAALCIARDQYQHDFSLQHASTFAEDDPSSRIALGVLELLDRDEGALVRRARRLGGAFLAGLGALQRKWPQVLADVRGRGLMLGLEFADQRENPSFTIRSLDASEGLAAVASGWLLAEERVRVAPALRHARTMRIQPPLVIDGDGIRRALAAIDRLCETIACGDGLGLTRYLHGEELTGSRRPCAATCYAAPPVDLARGSAYPLAHNTPKDGVPRVAFLGNCIDMDSVRSIDPQFAELSAAVLERMLRKMEPWSEHYPLRRFRTRSRTGAEVETLVFGWSVLPERWMAAFRDLALRSRLVDDIKDAYQDALEDGCRWVGFGGFTSILTDACREVRNERIRITSGNSLTVGMAFRGLERAAQECGIDLREETVGVVGAVGNIGRMYAHLVLPKAGRLLLLGRPGSEARLQECREELLARGSSDAQIVVAADLGRLRECAAIVTATNSPRPIIATEHLRNEPTVLLDVSVPGDAFPDLVDRRPQLHYLRGGIVRLPDGPDGQSKLQLPGWYLPEGHAYACLAETLQLGLENLDLDFSCGPLEAERVEQILELADRHGFELGAYKTRPIVTT